MTTNLPASLANLIPSIWHAQVSEAYAALVEQLVASRVAQAKEDILRSIVAHVASYGLVESPPQVELAQDEPAAVSKQHIIAAGERGVYHDQYVATFRAKFPNGERELREMIECFPGGAKLNRAQMDAIKGHFGMGERSLLLSPMLRELGCRDDSRGMWTTPVLRNSPTNGF